MVMVVISQNSDKNWGESTELRPKDRDSEVHIYLDLYSADNWFDHVQSMYEPGKDLTQLSCIHKWSSSTNSQKESGINIGVRLLIFELFFRGYVLIKGGYVYWFSIF